ncbi:MAG TPA: M14 family zinc carboxypeptidase [Longimicrobiales bacterium]|nr:M14 family zinc carboxypeptidase [Longimicrobiales bacterium]
MHNRRIGWPARTLLIAVAVLAARSDALAQQQPIDQEYTAQIRRFTTEPFFLTPLVDYLPASSTVPSPLKVLGHIAGAPDILSYPEEVNNYMRAVAAASPRVRVFSMGESEEGREMILVAVGDEQTIARLDDYKAMLGRLADPRRTPPEEAMRVIAQAKPIYWATGAMHSPETGSPEMVMELVYRLAVDEGEHIRAIRNNMIVLITPIQEVDGRAKVVDIHMAPRKDPAGNYPRSPLYWGKYVAHDNNRDNMSLSLKLTQHMVRTFLEYNPTVVHDLHESASYLYTSTGRGPYNAWIDPIVVSEWNRLAHREVGQMTAWGVPGVYTHDFYDGWAPNYMFWVANMRNSIGRFYETQGSGNASTRLLPLNVDRQWHRTNTPLRQVMWGIRNNVNLQQSALLIAMREVADNKAEFLHNFYHKSARSVAKARAEGPAGYVFPATDPRPGQQARLLDLLQRQGVEVQRTTAAGTVGSTQIPAGSYVVRMDQPFSRAADMLLDRQLYNPTDPSPYDDTGWTLGPLYNVETVRIEDVKLLDVPMQHVAQRITAPGGIASAQNARAFLVNYNADNRLTSFRFAQRNLRMQAAEADFRAHDRTFNAGSFIIPVQGNPGNLAQLLEQAGREFGFTAVGVTDVPAVASHPVVAPRVAIMHTWQTTQTEGWMRLGLDEYGIPFDYISVHEARDNPRLRDRYDVILFGPSSANALAIVNGVQGAQPLPWQQTPVTPNLGRQASTDDMRGGLELQGVLNLRNFVDQGGTLVTVTSTSSLPIHFGMGGNISIAQPQNLWAPGGVFRTERADSTSPLIYGYGAQLGVYFNRGPLFSDGQRSPVVIAAARPAADGSTTTRRSGRGGVDEPDIVQGRPRDLGMANVEEYRRSQAQQQDNPQQGFGAPPAAPGPRPRTVLRFAADPKNLLISGGLTNGAELAFAPALVDVPVGRGHVVMFSFNPFWRSETLGSYALVFNALLHHGNLSAGSRGRPTTQNPD